MMQRNNQLIERKQIMALKKSLGNKKKTSLRDKFKKKDTTILEKMYNEREEKSKAGVGGKSCFNQEMLEKFNVKEFRPHLGDNYIEILPASYDANTPYVFECAIHYSVGVSKDQFICLQRYSGKKCFRCDEQQKMYREHPKGTKPTDEIKALYPTDRAIWIMWDRTAEIAENEDPEYQISIWAAAKTKVHAEIQSIVRDKKKKVTLDISDVEEDGDGRTVSFEMIQKNKGDYPDYKGFSLLDRDEPIPDEILEQLDEIFSAAEEGNYKHPLEMFLHIPSPEEIKESMLTEMDDEEDEKPKSKKNKKDVEEDEDDEKSAKNKKDKGKKKKGMDEEEVMEKLEELKEELTEMKSFKFKKWCKENDYEDAMEVEDREEAVEAIIDDLYTKIIEGEIKDDDIPW